MILPSARWKSSTVLFPFTAGGQIFGGLAFGTLREERYWTEEEIARLQTVATLFERTLAHKRGEEPKSGPQRLDHGIAHRTQPPPSERLRSPAGRHCDGVEVGRHPLHRTRRVTKHEVV